MVLHLHTHTTAHQQARGAADGLLISLNAMVQALQQVPFLLLVSIVEIPGVDAES